MIRNGFSHSSFESILAKEPFKIKGIMGNLTNSELKHVEIDGRHSISISVPEVSKSALQQLMDLRYNRGLKE